MEVAKWLAGERKEDARPFIAQHFKVQVVGEITELAASSRLDSYFGKCREVLGIDLEVAKTGKMKGLQAGCLVIAQGLLHLAQHVVRAPGSLASCTARGTCASRQGARKFARLLTARGA